MTLLNASRRAAPAFPSTISPFMQAICQSPIPMQLNLLFINSFLHPSNHHPPPRLFTYSPQPPKTSYRRKGDRDRKPDRGRPITAVTNISTSPECASLIQSTLTPPSPPSPSSTPAPPFHPRPQ
ncbi:hypothetical protein BU23DRAFT_197714 [Bimuria novae-zelandiae CBS 107.79]|uniref:Uncharacterized protein n=1 Tax=Bimuria novae-zelandiae CBS 107.79 TaxID=1447943 RepID=A0A6A5V4I8_9PLEO|nr:hypothetical protein BU23DRAFT_197714 [Bimuria novae-zelandiae CBS 107.79]